MSKKVVATINVVVLLVVCALLLTHVAPMLLDMAAEDPVVLVMILASSSPALFIVGVFIYVVIRSKRTFPEDRAATRLWKLITLQY